MPQLYLYAALSPRTVAFNYFLNASSSNYFLRAYRNGDSISCLLVDPS